MPTKGLPDQIISKLNAADTRYGFPKGTMQSVMQQEVGGGVDKYLADPSTYHYGLNAGGKRIAGHTGKVSTAFGPFGILESTGANPGYGVKPLQDKSLDEQVRFSAEYLAARSKAAGGLVGGLAGYGEGDKYASQVVARRDGPGGYAPALAALSVGAGQPSSGSWSAGASSSVPGPVPLPPEILASLQAMVPAAAQASEEDAWGAFLRSMPGRAQPVNVASIDYGNPQMATQLPMFQFNARPKYRKPNFDAFTGWVG